jgi:hypothetical protein
MSKSPHCIIRSRTRCISPTDFLQIVRLSRLNDSGVLLKLDGRPSKISYGPKVTFIRFVCAKAHVLWRVYSRHSGENKRSPIIIRIRPSGLWVNGGAIIFESTRRQLSSPLNSALGWPKARLFVCFVTVAAPG